jgi:nanoRNase/pAp phosphatase (c-di-AMP/oligoRNAs hydrolase)
LEGSTKITTMRNPWLDFESPDLGKFMQRFGGGGHKRVGSVVLENGRQNLSQEVVSALLQLENSESSLKV